MWKILLILSIPVLTTGLLSGCAKAKLVSGDHPSVDVSLNLNPPEGGGEPPVVPPPVVLPPTPGFGMGAGGGISTATGVQSHATVGEVTSHNIQTATGVTVTSGLQGALVE